MWSTMPRQWFPCPQCLVFTNFLTDLGFLQVSCCLWGFPGRRYWYFSFLLQRMRWKEILVIFKPASRRPRLSKKAKTWHIKGNSPGKSITAFGGRGIRGMVRYSKILFLPFQSFAHVNLFFLINTVVFLAQAGEQKCVCVCVCVCERESVVPLSSDRKSVV